METNGSQEERSYGMAVGLFFALFIGQNLIGIIECAVLASLWKSHTLGLGAVAAIALVCSFAFPMVGIWAYETRYGV